MVANLPYDLTEDKVRSSSIEFDAIHALMISTAQGDLQGLPARFRQGRSPPHPPFHG